jgi:high-affinity iron transporter
VTARVLVLAAALVLVASPAHAAQVSPEEGVAELERARALVARSVSLYEGGNAEAAYEAARNAYLDHFEFVEIPLRVRDEALTLELEEDFAILRNQIQGAGAVSEVEATAAELSRGLDRVERRLSDPGLAAPLLAAISAFIILFREGFEAVLVIAAILGYLEASRSGHYRGAVLRGVAAAAIATVVTFLVAGLVFSLAPVERELLEAGTALLAVAVLFYVSFWLVSRLEQRRWMEFVKAKVWAAAGTGSSLALAGVGFTAVYREGFETVLFYQALLSFAEGLELWVAAGTAVAAILLGAVGWLIFRAGKRLPVKAFMTTAVVMVMALSVAFIGNAVRALQEAAMIPVTFLSGVPQLPIFLAELTGWHPTSQTLLAQAALTLVYVAGAAWTFVVLPRRQRRYAPPRPSEATPEGQRELV